MFKKIKTNTGYNRLQNNKHPLSESYNRGRSLCSWQERASGCSAEQTHRCFFGFVTFLLNIKTKQFYNKRSPQLQKGISSHNACFSFLFSDSASHSSPSAHEADPDPVITDHLHTSNANQRAWPRPLAAHTKNAGIIVCARLKTDHKHLLLWQ